MGHLADTTRVLVTHHTHYLRDADVVIVVDRGRIVQTGHIKITTYFLPYVKLDKISIMTGWKTIAAPSGEQICIRSEILLSYLVTKPVP